MGRLDEFFNHQEPGESVRSGGPEVPGPWSKKYAQAVGAKEMVFTRAPSPLDADQERWTKPITHVYRGMSHTEWGAALERGHIQSDERETIVAGEGTNAGVRPSTAEYYVEGNRQMEPGRVRDGGATRVINGKHFRVPLPHLDNVMTPLEHAGPVGSSGVIAKIRVHPTDGWTVGHDGYARTSKRIPISRVEQVGTVLGRGHIVPFKGYEASNESL